MEIFVKMKQHLLQITLTLNILSTLKAHDTQVTLNFLNGNFNSNLYKKLDIEIFSYRVFK